MGTEEHQIKAEECQRELRSTHTSRGTLQGVGGCEVKSVEFNIQETIQSEMRRWDPSAEWNR